MGTRDICDQSPLDGASGRGHCACRMATTADTGRTLSSGFGWFALAGLFLVGAALYNACRFYPADLPFFMPWEFSWPTFFVTFLGLGWFLRGLARTPSVERPAMWRIMSLVLGVLANYAVLQTHFDYLAQHMFFVDRAAYFVLHHFGAFLIALGASRGAVRTGMPESLKPLIDASPARRFVDFLQHPVIAPVLFVGLLYFWLIPEIHTRAMFDSNVYNVMNWTIAINGIFFWSLILDPRPKPPARISHGTRALLTVLVALPQIALGAILSLSTTDYYPVYSICGRVFAMTALDDQHYGGLITWLPSTLMSIVAIIVVLVSMRPTRVRERRARKTA